MTRHFYPILDLLDEGLSLYRRGFTSFLLISALWFVPVAIGIGITAATAQYMGSTAMLLVVLGWMLLSIPLAVYLVGVISRATVAIQQGQPVRLKEVLRMGPLRLAGMGCYAVIFYIVVSLITSVIGMFCFCPMYTVLTALLSSIGMAFGESSGMVETGMMIGLGLVTMMLFMLFYGLSLAMSGATYSSLVYALQPFVQDTLTFGDSIERSVNLTFYRLGQNLLAFVFASFIFAATSISVTVTLWVLLPLPLFWTLGSESPIAQGSSAMALLLGLIVVLPPMPIWMALLYQRNLDAYQGRDLVERVAAYQEAATDTV
jgi:hypothetical protein